jgi:protease I
MQENAQPLHGITVAILVTDGFEQVEMTEPRKALDAAGAHTILVSPAQGQVRSFDHIDPSNSYPVDRPLADADPSDFDALLLPGGVINPDALRIMPSAVDFVRAFFDAEKPVGAICHGPWTIVNAGHAKGRTLTSWPSLQLDLENAGATWVDEEVVRDNNLVTSRKPDDIPAFNHALVDLFARKTAAAR